MSASLMIVAAKRIESKARSMDHELHHSKEMRQRCLQVKPAWHRLESVQNLNLSFGIQTKVTTDQKGILISILTETTKIGHIFRKNKKNLK